MEWIRSGLLLGLLICTQIVLNEGREERFVNDDDHIEEAYNEVSDSRHHALHKRQTREEYLYPEPCESGGKLHCWTCDEKTDDLCEEKGSYQLCAAGKQICKYVQFKTEERVKRFCAKIPYCNLESLQGHDCDNEKCVRCSYDNITSDCPFLNHACSLQGPAYPCDKAAGESLYCWHCKHVKNEAQCMRQGQWNKCKDPNDICVTKTYLGPDIEPRITRGCFQRDSCHDSAFNDPYCCDQECHECHFEENQYSCDPPEQTCYCRGDPHCYTFDGKPLQFASNCWHLMARDGCTDGIPTPAGTPTFSVVVEAETPPSATSAFIQRGQVEISGVLTCTFDQGLAVTCTPTSAETAYWMNTGTEVVFSYDFGGGKWLEVRWDGVNFVAVDVSSAFKDELCGMCMDYNDDRSDELMLGPQTACQTEIPNNESNLMQRVAESWRTTPSCNCAV